MAMVAPTPQYYVVLPILFYVLTFNSHLVSSQSLGAAALIDAAKQYGAPFADTAFQRLHGDVFGSGRATRSTDVVLFNKSSRKFNLISNSCSHGDWSTGLFPEPTIQSKKSSVYGMESHGFATGVQCTVKYQSPDGVNFAVTSNNPYVGGNSASEDYSKDSVILIRTLGGGNNNQVRWIIEDK